MAVNRPLTTTEKTTLSIDPGFIAGVKQAIKDQAMYWRGQDGQGLISVALATRWRKSRDYAEEIIANPQEVDNQQIKFVSQFLIFMKSMNLWDNAIVVFDPATVVTYLNTTGAGHDAVTFSGLADTFFDQQIITKF